MRKVLFLVVLMAALLIPILSAQSEPTPFQTTLEFDFLSRLLTLDEATIAAASADPSAAADWLNENLGEIASPEILDELLASRLPFALLGEAESLTSCEIEVTPLDSETSGPNRIKFTVRAEAVMADGSARTLTFFGRLTKDEAAGRITALRLNLLP